MSTPLPRSRRATGTRPGRTTSFAPYYKVQVYNPLSLSWKPRPGMYATEEAAWAKAPEGARLMLITPESKTPITR